MRKQRKLARGMIPAVMAAAVASAATGQAWAAPAQPGTVKESEKPAAQPGTEKEEERQEAAPEPVTQEAAPEPVTQEAAPEPVTQEHLTPAKNVTVAEPVRQPADEPSVTPVRQQAGETEVTPVREKQEVGAVETEYQPVAVTTDLDDSEALATNEGDDVIRPEEEEEAEKLPEDDDEGDDEGTDTGDVLDASQTETAVNPVTENPATQAPALEQPTATTFSGGAALQAEAAGVGVGVDTTTASTTVSGGINALGQEGTGHIQTTAVDDQTIEIAVNDFEPVSIQTTVTDQSASVSINDSAPLTMGIPQVDVPAEVATVVDQAAADATAAANQLAGQAEQLAESLPDAGDFEAQLPAGLTASAWFQSN